LSISIQTQILTPLKSFTQLHAPTQYKILTHYKLDSTSGRLVHWIDLEICTCHTSPRCEPTQPPLHTNKSSIMYDKVSPPETFLPSYVSSCSHPIQTSFNSHHLVIIVYLIHTTSRVRISLVHPILRQCTS